MILDLHRQGLSLIARQTDIYHKTVRKYIERGLAAPAYGPRRPRATLIDRFTTYLRERVNEALRQTIPSLRRLPSASNGSGLAFFPSKSVPRTTHYLRGPK